MMGNAVLSVLCFCFLFLLSFFQAHVVVGLVLGTASERVLVFSSKAGKDIFSFDTIVSSCLLYCYEL